MFAVFFHTVMFLNSFFQRVSAAVPAPDLPGSPCFIARASAGSGLRSPKGGRDLDPVTCCGHCRDEGYQVATLTSEGCYCGNWPLGLVVTEFLNTPLNGRRQDVHGQGERQNLSLSDGDQLDRLVLYRTEGPFLHTVRLSGCPLTGKTGKTFHVEVSGNLSVRPNHATGIPGVGGQDLAYITVGIEEITSKGQSSHVVHMLDDGSFNLSSDWISGTPGNYKLNVSVFNPRSTDSSILHLSILQSTEDSLVISVRPWPLVLPSCISFLLKPNNIVKIEAADPDDRVTLRTDLGDFVAVEFSWCLGHQDGRKNMECLKKVFFPSSDCLNRTVVDLAIPDFRLGVSGCQLTPGEGVSPDEELFTTMKHVNLRLRDDCQSIDLKDDLRNAGGCHNESCSDKNTNINIVEINLCKLTHQKENGTDPNCNNCSRRSICWQRSPHLHHVSNGSTRHLHVQLHCHLSTSAGQNHLTVSADSTSDPSSSEPMCTLKPSGNWKSAVSTQADFSLEVVRPGSQKETRVIWTFSVDDVVVLNRTTEEWNVNVSLKAAGLYTLTVEAFNWISWASFCTHILAQDPVGDLVLNVPGVIMANRKQSVWFSVTAGSDVTVSLTVNATVLYKNSSYATGEEVMVVLILEHPGTVLVELHAENRVSVNNESMQVFVEGNWKPSPQVRVNPMWQPPTSQTPVHNPSVTVKIYAEKTAYQTNTDVKFLAVAQVPDSVVFLWHFGDLRSARTTLRTITKRYHKPGRYDVIVAMSRGRTTLTSDVFPLVVQRAVKLNRLTHQASVLQNQTVTFSCRVSAGTNVSFLWSFGDGSFRLGQSSGQHVFNRTGEFRVTVNASNLVSSASLSSHIFVVDRPCQPPPVKNMGPLKLQVRRYEVIHLGVTYETEVECDTSGGLLYTWTLFDSAGRIFPLPFIDTHKQSLILPGHLLDHHAYTAIANVQVVGSVVYSNYSVRVQVVPSLPLAVIQGGTNFFINRSNTTEVTLDGQKSYDPDFPMNPVSFSWTCKPVSSIISSCFHHDVPTSSPVITFPASSLKHNFDQFQFMLTIHSGERSSSSETFLTMTSNMIRKVMVYCPQCQGDQVTQSQSFSVSASCEGCDIDPKYIQYTWSLYLVNASSKPAIEVPFCYTVDLTAPSNIMEVPVTLILNPPAADASQQTPTTPVSLDGEDSGRLLKHHRQTSTMALFKGSELPPISSLVRIRRAAAGEEPFHHPVGDSDPPDSFLSPTEYQPPALGNRGIPYSDRVGHYDAISEFQIDLDSSADGEMTLPVLESSDMGGQPDLDYDVPLMSPKEGEPGISAGRPMGLDDEILDPEADSVFNPVLHEDEGSNLVDSRQIPSVMTREPILLDLPRELVHRGLFESYTDTGISSPLLRFRPFSLKAGSRYMLDVTAESHGGRLGRTQLFLQTNPAPKGVTCQVQPMTGRELYTHFSIFCSSGKEDLIYEYSIRVEGGARRILYSGRDFQYYFNLPSGDPRDDYKVTIYTEIRSSMYGSATKPCPVTVRVHPSFFRDTSSSSSSSSSSLSDPDLELSDSGLRNLSALVRLGNSVEVRNYVSLLSGILNRLSLDTDAITHVQIHTRNVLICTMCELESREQASMVDNISILRDLLQVRSQVSLVSVRRVTRHVKVISEHSPKSRAPVWYNLDQETLHTLVTLLSYSLQAVVPREDFKPDWFNRADIKYPLQSSSHEENIRNAPSSGCTPDPPVGFSIRRGGSISSKQVVADILQTASDLILKHVSFHGAHRVRTEFLALYTAYLNQTSAALRSSSATIYMPASMIKFLFDRGIRGPESRPHRECVLSVVTELNLSPLTWAPYPGRLSGPVVDLSLYECSARRKIPVRSLIQPIEFNLQQPARNEVSVLEYVLHRSQLNYHSFNITKEHLQHATQMSVVFTPPLNKAFPVLLLFRMFERPTPNVHHLQKIHQWESNTTRFTLPSSYLSAPGVGHLALLNADFGKATRHKHMSEEVNYRLTVESSLCLSWDDHQGAWTPHRCRTWQADTTTAVSCRCHHLRPLTVMQQQIQSSHETTGLDPFLSVSSNLTVFFVLVLCVCLYIPSLVACKRDDVLAEENRRFHYLPDNSPCDPYVYAVTIHTSPCSAARMSAKVYLVLKGEDGVSQTRELQVPGCTLFRRNSRDTFIISSAESLGAVWGVHIWHDNSGPSPSWYLRHVEVSELGRGRVEGRVWLFLGQCWLAVNKDDGRVERILQVCTQGIGFAKMLRLKLYDYLAEYHMWISVHTCPSPASFTRTQRLSVSLLLLCGYALVSTTLISQIDDMLLFDVGLTHVPAVSVATGVLSVLAVLPVAAVISFLFRLQEVKLTRSGIQHVRGHKAENAIFEDAQSVTYSTSEPHLWWDGVQQWAKESWSSKPQGTEPLAASTMTVENKNTDKEPYIETDVLKREEDKKRLKPQSLLLITGGGKDDRAPQRKDIKSSTLDEGEVIQEETYLEGTRKEGSVRQAARLGHYVTSRLGGKGFMAVSQWSHYLVWTLCALLSVSCLVLSAALGSRFSSSQALLWIHSFFFSLISCIFLIQPAVIMTVAVAVSFWYRQKADFHIFASRRDFETEISQIWSQRGINHLSETSAFPQERCSYLEKLLRARQRTRYLCLVRPPTPAELRRTRGKTGREALFHQTLRDISVCVSMVLLMLCISYGSSSTDHHHLTKAIRKQFISGHDDAFMSIKHPEDWWRWAQTSLLNSLYKNASATAETNGHILIGEPILQKTEASSLFHRQRSGLKLVPEYLRLLLCQSRTSQHPQSNISVPAATNPETCGRLGCNSEPSATVGLGRTKSDAESRLKLLLSGGWLGSRILVLKVQFTLFSPEPNLFTSVTMLTEQSPIGGLLPSARVQSVRVYHHPAVWDYVGMACQLLFLLLSLLQLCHQVYTVGQQGLLGYWRKPSNWLEVCLLTATLTYYIFCTRHSIIILELVDLLQRRGAGGHVDVSRLATSDQYMGSTRGALVFLLTIKSVTVLRVNKMMATPVTLLTHTLSSLLWPTITGLIFMVALSCVVNLVFGQSSLSFSSLSGSLQTLLCHHWCPRPLRGVHVSWNDFLYRGLLYLSSMVVWTGVVVGVTSSLVRHAKRSQSRRNVFTFTQLLRYIKRRLSDFTGQHGKIWTKNHLEGKTYHFEEFESLLDELLFKLDALPDGLPHTLPPKAHRFLETSPIISPIQEPPSMAGFQDSFRPYMTENVMLTDHEDVRGSKLEMDFLQQKGHKGDPSSLDDVETLKNAQQTATTDGENPKERELQSLKTQSYLPHPDSTPLIRVRTEEVLKNQLDQRTKIRDCCRFSESQTTHAEVVVEVLVHKDLGNVAPNKW